MSDEELKSFLAGIEQTVNNLVGQLPSHKDFINHYCKSSVV
jgi:tryptophan halogenase